MSYSDCEDPDLSSGYDGEEAPASTEPKQSPSTSLQSPIDIATLLKDPNARDWNGEFQKLLAEATVFEDSATGDEALEREFERTAKLRQLSNAFAEEATRIAVQIIGELFLPVSLRRIKSVSHIVGGVAGGEKFIHSGIFFKLSRDWKGIYGSDGHAIKAAELELKGTMALLDCRISGLHFPLMALIRYRGFAIVAQSILPIQPSTLLYGSGDAGRSFKNEDPLLASKFAAAARLLNLKAHTVWTKDKLQSVVLHGPADIEGHLGSDGLYYVVDTARLFPPTSSKSKLYALLRPEFVKLNPVPLSSDAFSAFGGADNTIHDQEVAQATKRLLDQSIPSFSRYLDERFKEDYAAGDKPSWSFSEFSTTLDLNTLGAEMHLHGINYRYLLSVWAHVDFEFTKTIALVEACSRTAKHLLEERWRCLEAASELQYLRDASDFFALLAGSDEDSLIYWEETMADEVLERFPLPPQTTKGPFPEGFKLHSTLPVSLLLFRTSQLLGLEFDLSVLYSSSGHEDAPDTFDEKVFKGLTSLCERRSWAKHGQVIFRAIHPRTKYLHRVSFEEGTALCRVALTKKGAEAKKLFRSANDKFHECLTTKPNDYRALYNWAFALSQQAAAADPEEARSLWKEMSEKFSRALILQPKDWRALWKWGTALQTQSRFLSGDAAIFVLADSSSKLNQAVSLLLFPHFKTIFNAGNADLALARAMDHSANKEKYPPSTIEAALIRATQHLGKAMLLEPNSVDAVRNAAVATAMLARMTSEQTKRDSLYAKTFKLYQKATEIDPKNPEVKYSCGNAHFRRAIAQKDANDNNGCKVSLSSSGGMYSAALECNPKFRDSFVNLAITIALAVKWKLSLFEDSTWVRPLEIFLTSANRFENQLSPKELSSVAAACKGLSTPSAPEKMRLQAASILDKASDLMKESGSSSTESAQKQGSRKRSTSVGQDHAASPKRPGVRTLATSAVISPIVSSPSPSPSPSPIRSSSSLSLTNNRHGETDSLSILSIISTPREDSMSNNSAIDPSPSSSRKRSRKSERAGLKVSCEFVSIDWTQPVPFAYDGDISISESKMRLQNSLLGRSKSGLVFFCEHNGQNYALKARPKREVTMTNRLAVFKGPLFVSLKYILQSEGKVCFLYERVAGCPLDAAVSKRQKDFGYSALCFYFAELVAAFSTFCEASLDIVDFKASSVLFTHSGHLCLLISFLDCRDTEDVSQNWLKLGSYMQHLLSCSSILSSSMTHESSKLVSFVQQLTDKDTSKRLKEFKKIKKHPIFEGVKWRKVGCSTAPLRCEGPANVIDIQDHGIAATLMAPEVPNQLDGFTIVNTPNSHRL